MAHNMSGNAYVSARLTGDRRRSQVPVREPHLCDHTATMCATRSCVESWAIDWEVSLWRTGAGRTIASAIGHDTTSRRPFPAPVPALG